MKVGAKGLKMSNGTVRHFASTTKRNNFERVAQAVKHGFNPNKKSYKTGGIIPKTGMYKLHEGEMVVPATMPMSVMAHTSFDALKSKFEKDRAKYLKLSNPKGPQR